MNKVSIFSISDSLGGAEQVLFKIAKFYSEKENNRIKVYFFKSQSNTYWEDNLNSNIEIIYLNNSIISLFKQIRKQNFQIVFSSHLMINAFLGICRTIGVLKTKKLIVRESTQVFGRYSGIKLLQYKLAYFFGYRNIDLIICQTQRMVDNLKENVPYLFKRTKVKVIPNPFDFPDEKQIFEQIDISDKFIVSAGRLISEKGFKILIDAFAKLLNDFPDLRLVILGEGKLRGELENQIKELKIERNVILKGFVNNVYPYFRQAELCVVSSIREGFPNVLLQMMSQNDKVVSTLCAGDIDKIKGLYLAETNDVESLYTTIKNNLISDLDDKRTLFDSELKNRSIEMFIQQIDKN